MIAKMNNSIFIRKPNLPINTVSSVIASAQYSSRIGELSRMGISIIKIPPTIDVIGAEKYHADISMIHIGGNNIIVAKNNQYLTDILISSGFNVKLSYSEISGAYPKCTALNALVLNKVLICRSKSLDLELYNYCTKNNLRIINVNQGYTRCSVAVVAENAIITSDTGIYNACIENKIDALKIDAGYIEIDGYDYGFIGGTCGKLSKDILAFCGRVEYHKDFEKMKAFALNYGVRLLSLSNDILFDIGSILPVIEKNQSI